MTDPSFFDVVLQQRACREFDPDPVPDEDIERILDAATHAPSGENTQPWVFVVVRDPEVRAELVALTLRLWAMARADAMARLDPKLGAEVDDGMRQGYSGAPVLVVVGADTATGVHPKATPSSIFPAVQNLLLAANALGYGSALTTLTTAAADELRTIVDLPPEVIPMAVVPLGRPARRLGRPRRRPARETTHRDRFGRPW
ncbi:MAG TPA: nitroreductase family protein [Acidimicrobiales bacterium]|nr:nitroreductase family protein [Acidimicrobiales bacterium]